MRTSKMVAPSIRAIKPLAFTVIVATGIGIIGVGLWKGTPGTMPNGGTSQKSLELPSVFVSLPQNPTGNQFAERIHGLGRNLSQEEQSALIYWIIGVKPSDLADSSWHWVVNEAMDVLCRQIEPSPRLSTVLIEMYTSRETDPVLRDYAIQHLASRLERSDFLTPVTTDPKEREEIVATLIAAAEETNESFSGTALQGLHRILPGASVPEDGSVAGSSWPVDGGAKRFREAALRLACSSQANQLARITALQICAQRGFNEVVSEARLIAESKTLPTSLRLSAIGLIGLLGTKDDRKLLTQVSLEASPRLLVAVNVATQRINQRAVTASNAITK